MSKAKRIREERKKTMQQYLDDRMYEQIRLQVEYHLPYHYTEATAVLASCRILADAYGGSPYELEQLWYSREDETDIAL